MSIDVRPIREDELVSWLDAQTTAFLVRPDLPKIADEVRQHWDLGRVWAATDGDRIVGTARTYATELTVPGNRQIKASALTQVAVLPTHRRRGALRAMLDTEHSAARERGELVSMLYASEAMIYTRFGYGTACQTSGWSIDVSSTSVHEAAGGRTGSVELLPIDEAALVTVRDVYEQHRLVQPGEIWRRPITWQSDLGLAGHAWGDTWKGYLAVHRTDGAVDGYARYRGEGKWERRQPRSTITVDELQALTPDAEVALLRFLASVDLVTTVQLERRTPTDRLPWLLTNPRAAEPVEPGDGLWVKLHDIPRALEARAYERPGSVVLEVAGGSAGAPARVALDAGPDGARAVPTDRPADLTLDAAALGAAYLGGTRLRDAVLARGVDEHRPGALAEADAMFACLNEPWCSTFF